MVCEGNCTADPCGARRGAGHRGAMTTPRAEPVAAEPIAEAAGAAEAPLAGYTVVGCVTRWHQDGPDAPRRPGGSCWHCGIDIAVCVQIRRPGAHELHEIGTTCAERVGLSGPELRAMLAELYGQERATHTRAAREAAEAAARAREEHETARHGPHGSAGRYLFGCSCGPCRTAAPHASLDRFFDGACRCLACIEVVAALPEYRVQPERAVLVELAGATVVAAREVDGRYGRRWCVGGGLWLAWRPARRSTLARQGYTEATAPYLVEVCGRGSRQWYRPVCALGSPLIDRWGEPIPRPPLAPGT